MTTLTIINEDFLEMHFGQNTSLFYIVQELKNKNDVYIFNLDKQSLPDDASQKIFCSFLKKDSESSKLLIEKFEFFNKKIIDSINNKDFDALLNLKAPKAGEFIATPQVKEINLNEFSKIIQRLEPMKAPFPPEGEKNIDDVLSKLKTLLPNKKLHLPIALNDKMLPLKLNEALGYEVATPTVITNLDDKNFKEKIALSIKSYQKIYDSKNEKIVIKPINSAQSLGVFAIKFSKTGQNLEEFQKQSPKALTSSQIFHVRNDLNDKEILEIFQILCFTQNSTSDKDIIDISKEEIKSTAKKLYNEEILIQPFIEGVKNGDIRANVLKNENDQFYLAGFVYRKSIQKDDNFTTCYSGGKALSLPISYLTLEEQKNLQDRTEEILKILNNQLKQEYKNVLELGFDFLLVGDDKNILLGEINHHCPALLPISAKLKIHNN